MNAITKKNPSIRVYMAFDAPLANDAAKLLRALSRELGSTTSHPVVISLRESDGSKFHPPFVALEIGWELAEYDLRRSARRRLRPQDRRLRIAWKQYYTEEHIERVLYRAAAKDQDIYKVMFLLLCLGGSIALEGIHPLEAGMFRLKVRTMRRPGMPLENPLIFYPRRAWEIASLSVRWLNLVRRFFKILRRVQAHPQQPGEVDLAMVPVEEQHDEDLTLMQVYRDHIPVSRPAKETTTAAH